MSQEIVAAKKMLGQTVGQHAFRPKALAAEKSYGTGTSLAWLLKPEIAPHVLALDRQHTILADALTAIIPCQSKSRNRA